MEKKEIVRALKVALQLLWDGSAGASGEQHVCLCLTTARDRQLISYSQWLSADRLIKSRLGRCYTVVGWLQTQPGFHAVQKWATREQLQAYRRAWVLSMIKEFENA